MEITGALKGKTVAAVMHNGRVLCIKCSDGTELNVAWVDDNGVPVRGVPTLAQHGYRINAGGIKDLIVFPNSTKQPISF